MSEVAISLRRLCKSYRSGSDAQQVLFDVDLDVSAGELIAIVGRSGCGKTTLLNLIGGLDRQYSGDIQVLGKHPSTLSDADLSAFRNTSIGFVFQQFNVLEHLSVSENVALPSVFAPADARVDVRERTDHVLHRVGLEDRASDLAAHLSGGQKQRVAIARALFHRPPILLCDEPTGNLDSATGQQIIDLFSELNREEGLTLLVVTHESRVSSAAHRVLEMEDGRLAGVVESKSRRAVGLQPTVRSSLASDRTAGVALGSLLSLVWQNLRRNRKHDLISAIGITVGIAVFAFFLALGAGAREVVLGDIFPVDRLEVVPRKATLFGAQRPIDDRVVEQIRALPSSKPKEVYPRLRLAVAAHGWGGKSLLGRGRDIHFEVGGFCDGVAARLVAEDVAAGLSFRPPDKGVKPCGSKGECPAGRYCAPDLRRCVDLVPALISPYMVELYNASIAPMHAALPRIPAFADSVFSGKTFTVEVGRSFLGGHRSARKGLVRRFRLVGVSDKAIPLGITIPIEYVKRWNALYAGQEAATSYSSVVVEAQKEDITFLVAAIKDLGFDLAPNRGEQVGLFITLVAALFALISLTIVAVAAINIAHTFLMLIADRLREIGLLRAIGARRIHVASAIIGEAAAVGFVGGVAGLLLARLGAFACDWMASRWLPDYPFKPDSHFEFSVLLMVGAVAFSVAFCVLGALLPAYRAARMQPARALSTR